MSDSMLDDDTRRTVNSGRESVGTMLSAAQQELQKVFIGFVLALVGTIYFLRQWGWEVLKDIMEARMDELTAEQTEVIVRTPFDVILLQIKLGLGLGIIVALLMILFYSREPLRERGVLPESPTDRWKVWALGAMATALFTGGVAYAYYVFFPFAFEFLTVYTLQIGFNPSYDIVKWTHFIILLTLSFGLAAELPLAMSALAYAEIIPYETFRDRWRHAVLGIFVFGAVFSPPDPFTQIMWAAPLVLLYAFSLYLAKFFTALRRSGSAHVHAKIAANRWRIVGGFALVIVTVFALLAGFLAEFNALLRQQGVGYVVTLEGLGLPFEGVALSAAVAVLWGLVALVPLLVYYSWPELEPRERRPDPTDVDLDELDAEGVAAAPVETFAALSEDEATVHASRALDVGDKRKARAILDRFDEAQEAVDDGEVAGPDATAESTENVADRAKGATAGVVDTFTDEETTEEDIGGYYYDLAFILESLTSRSFRVAAIFMASLGLTFFALYQGGFKLIRDDFFGRLPAEIVDQDVTVVALHPVEAILFEIKMSLIAAVLVTLPAILYYTWPAIETRFRGITHDYETPAPGAAVAARWNRVAAFYVLAAGLTYVAVTNGVWPFAALAVDSSVTVSGYTLTAAQALYVNLAGMGLLGAVPAAGYYAWPSLRERWMIESTRGAFVLWAVTLVGGVVVGSILGYSYIAPAIITYLVVDAIDAGMVISYTINDFFWLVFATTAGIGLLADIPLTMWLFARTGIVSYETMRERWRGVVFIVFVAAAFFTNHSIITMLIFGLPINFMYFVGLAGLWFWTLPSRVLGRTGEVEEVAD